MPIITHLPNGEHVCYMHTCMLHIPLLPSDACAAHIIPSLALHLLHSVVTICNVGFTKIGCTIMYCGQIIVCSHKCTQTGLWMIPLTPWSTTAPTALSATNLPSVAMAANDGATSSSAEYAFYVHQLLCSPPAFTLLHALATSTKLTSIPGLTGIDLFPSPMLHGHWQRPYALPLLKHCINMQQSHQYCPCPGQS